MKTSGRMPERMRSLFVSKPPNRKVRQSSPHEYHADSEWYLDT